MTGKLTFALIEGFGVFQKGGALVSSNESPFVCAYRLDGKGDVTSIDAMVAEKGLLLVLRSRSQWS